MKNRLVALWVRLGPAAWPSWARPIVRDVIEGAIAAVVTFPFTMPHGVSGAQSEGVAAAVAVAAAVVAVLRREALPVVVAWFEGSLAADPTKP